MVKRISFEGIWEKHLIGLNRHAYYTTRLYRARKKWLCLNANLICQDCGLKVEKWIDLEPHHTKYNEDWGLDQPGDFIIVCHSCHEKRHGKKLNYKIKYTEAQKELVYRRKVDRENALREEKRLEAVEFYRKEGESMLAKEKKLGLVE